MFKFSKRGESSSDLLFENIIFIVLNLTFLIILIVFIALKTGNAATLEEIYAKQIALVIDSAKPGMIVHLNMQKAIEKAKSELGENNKDDIIIIEDNVVTVKLRENGGYSYSFFNDIKLNYFIDSSNNRDFVFVFGDYTNTPSDYYADSSDKETTQGYEG